MELQNMSAHDLERIEELKRLGFELVECGFRNTHGEQVTNICYWRHMRGRRVSALQPNPEAAWLDAIRTYEEATDAVKANPGVHRVARMPAEESKELGYLKRHAEAQGYTFKKGSIGEGQCWVFQGMTEGGHDTHAKAIRGAIKHWARRDPESFVNSMNILGSGGSETEITPLSSEELAKLQGIPGFKEMPDEHQELTVQSQQLLKHLKQRGIQIDMSLIDPGALVEAASVSYKSQGKSFEEVEEDQRNAAKTDPAETSARAAGWTNFEDSEDASLLVVAHDNRDVHFTGPEAWEQACQWEKDNELWNGVGQPPVGTTLWITPHNTFWGFPEVGTYLCEVLAYHSDYVWLQLLSDTGEVVLGKYVTTRTDKVDVKVWKGNKDA